jgi:hypothetical protein
MKVPILTITQIRRACGSRIIAAGATGSTSMQQSQAIQANVYDELTQLQGVANKALANADILDKCQALMIDEDPVHEAHLRDKRKADSEIANKKRKEDLVKVEFKKTKT